MSSYGHSMATSSAASVRGPRQVAKTDLAYNMQTFCSRPSKKFEDTTLGERFEVATNFFEIKTRGNFNVLQYDIQMKKVVQQRRRGPEKPGDARPPKKITREETRTIFWELVKQNKNLFPDPSCMLYNDVNMLFCLEKAKLNMPMGQKRINVNIIKNSVMRLDDLRGIDPPPRLDGKPHKMETYEVEIKYTDMKTVNFSNLTCREDAMLVVQLVDAILTQRVRKEVDYPKENRKGEWRDFATFKNYLFLTKMNVEGNCAPLYLGRGLEAWSGFCGAVKPNLERGLLYNIDIAHSVFWKRGMPLLEFYVEVTMNMTVEEFKQEMKNPDTRRSLAMNNPQISILRRELGLGQTLGGGRGGGRSRPPATKGMTLAYGPPQAANDLNATLTMRPVTGIGRPPIEIYFKDGDNYECSVAEYYLHKYNYQIQFPSLPCIEFGLASIPMELVSVPNAYQKKKGRMEERQGAEMIRRTAFTAPDRFDMIQYLSDLVVCEDEYSEEYGVSLDKSPLTVRASRMLAPVLQFKNRVVSDAATRGKWNLVERVHDIPFAQAGGERKQVVGCIVNVEVPTAIQMDGFGALMKCLHGFGIDVPGGPQAFAKFNWRLSAPHEMAGKRENQLQYDALERWMIEMKANILSKFPKASPFFLFVLNSRCTNRRAAHAAVSHMQHQSMEYAAIKLLADVRVGVHAQCILHKTYLQLNSDTAATTLNVALKIMGKIGAKHYVLKRNDKHKNWTRLTNPDEAILLLAVDVSHPGIQDRNKGGAESKSVAAIIGNVDTDMMNYDSSIRVQDQGQENTVNMEEQITERIKVFQENTKMFPKHIIVLRDGASESEFQRTLYEEKMAIMNVCDRLCAGTTTRPTLTYIAVSKRHKVKFFPTGLDQYEVFNIPEDSRNLCPGTLVESGVTSTQYFDFFLLSQYAEKGCARPAHYYVLYDDWKPSDVFWQTVLHCLTYAYVRCTKTISLPAPLMYAHLVARRAKDYIVAYQHFVNPDIVAMDDYVAVQELMQATKKHKDVQGMSFV